MIKKNISNLVVVFTLVLMLMPGVLYAQFEPSITIDDASTGETPQLIPEGNLDAVITPTTADTTGYDLLRYVYTWNNSKLALSDNDLGAGDTSVPHTAKIVISTDADAQFGTSDGLAWYLHVKTVYSTLPAAPGIALSEDTIAGPYTFDNVPPSATISLDETVDGQTADTTSVSPVTIAVTGDWSDITAVFVNTSGSFNTATAYDFTDPSTKTLTYPLAGTGSKTLYAWFEDAAGNISDAASVTFTVIAGKFMDPPEDLTLGIGNTRPFEIAGAGAESYTWTIVDAADGTTPSAAATVEAGAYTAVVTGVSDGTIKVKAETAGASPIYSGIITVEQLGYTITHSYKAGLNLVPFSLSGTGLSMASDLRGAIESANPGVSVSQIFGWDAANQRYQTAFVVFNGTGLFDFQLVEGASYFVQTDGAGTLNIQGSEYVSISVATGLNLLSAPYSKLNTLVMAADFDSELNTDTGLDISQIFGWDAVNQRYGTAYVVFNGTGLFDFSLDIGAQGYFVQLSGNGTYTP
ncbi:hypothetical protein [Desulfobacula sp.]|uniref:hypothetical protein n=1 Tax=Desulfobacula sp. TaxID=2593537 RepID=UPI00261525DD|nr:hypothetical protein [Desulfobacula sp.]